MTHQLPSRQVIDRYLERLKKAIDLLDVGEISRLALLLQEIRSNNAKVLIAGNGGSSTTASHFALDWMLGTELENPSLRVLNLAESPSAITATGNDKDFVQVFSRQLRRLASPGDMLLVISASGNSPNLVDVIELGKKLSLRTVAITGFDGGQLKTMCDLNIHVPTDIGDYGVAEDLHLAVGHIIKEILIGSMEHG